MFAKEPGLDVRSAGTSEEALVRVNQRMLEWADIVFLMDDHQRRAVTAMFPDHPAVVNAICLDIPDHYAFLDPQLVAILLARATPYLEKLKTASPFLSS